MKFSNVVRSEAELRALMGDPVAPSVVEKTMTSLDRYPTDAAAEEWRSIDMSRTLGGPDRERLDTWWLLFVQLAR